MDGPKYLIHEITQPEFKNWYIGSPKLTINTEDFSSDYTLTVVSK